ncbi:hypothetical protein B0J14DRAFT_564001 [Halenospora varia]|nr:hypothetical protein B0J14DRAFT_564001 [Halenospora varia]
MPHDVIPSRFSSQSLVVFELIHHSLSTLSQRALLQYGGWKKGSAIKWNITCSVSWSTFDPRKSNAEVRAEKQERSRSGASQSVGAPKTAVHSELRQAEPNFARSAGKAQPEGADGASGGSVISAVQVWHSGDWSKTIASVEHTFPFHDRSLPPQRKERYLAKLSRVPGTIGTKPGRRDNIYLSRKEAGDAKRETRAGHRKVTEICALDKERATRGSLKPGYSD